MNINPNRNRRILVIGDKKVIHRDFRKKRPFARFKLI